MVDQTKEWAPQSLRYVTADLGGRANLLPDFLAALKDRPIASVCDIGCGSGANLQFVAGLFGATGQGVEPSADAVTLLNEKFGGAPQLKFRQAFAHQLPFDSDSFDLVMCWSVLHWVGRNEYLQSLGEMVRVTRQYLLVMDFVSDEDYRTAYAHQPGFHTYKMDFDAVLSHSGTLQKMDERRWWQGDKAEPVYIEREALKPFAGNPINWHSRKMVLYRKDAAVLPLHADSHFLG